MPVSDRDPRPPFAFTDGQLEALKWIAVASMFVDHFGRHLLGWPQESIVFGAGRLAFPLFALVLAFNLARPGDRAARTRRTAVRLAIACLVSQPAAVWARGEPALVNVFGTLGLGAALCWVLATKGHLAWRIPLCLVLTGAAGHAEFDVMGVCLVPALYLWRAEDRREAGVFALVLFLAVTHLNGVFGGVQGYLGTLLVLPLALAVARLPLRVPRMRWFFYAIYPLHLALIGALLTTGVVQKPRPKAEPPSRAGGPSLPGDVRKRDVAVNIPERRRHPWPDRDSASATSACSSPTSSGSRTSTPACSISPSPIAASWKDRAAPWTWCSSAATRTSTTRSC
jgi:hypothetical protein